MCHLTSKKQLKELYISILQKKLTSLLFFLLFSIFSNLLFNSLAFCQSPIISATDSLHFSTSNSLDSTLLPKKIRSNFSIGFRGGITSGRFEIANPQKNDKNSSGIGSVFTVFTNYKLNSHFSLQPELALGHYVSHTTLYKIALLQGTVDYTISTLDLNLIGIYSYSITDWLSISAETGLSGAGMYNSFGKVVAPNVVVEGENYDVNSDNQFKKLNYGVLVGINPSFSFKNVTLQTSIRYRHGLNNLNTFDYKLNRYLVDSDRTIKTRDIIFQVGFLIPIYKKAKQEVEIME